MCTRVVGGQRINQWCRAGVLCNKGLGPASITTVVSAAENIIDTGGIVVLVAAREAAGVLAVFCRRHKLCVFSPRACTCLRCLDICVLHCRRVGD